MSQQSPDRSRVQAEARLQRDGGRLSARELVMNRLVRRVRAFPELEIAPLVTEGLPARDAALAWAIDSAVSRRWLTLSAMLSVHLSRPWDRIEPGAQAALLAGAAQLVFMDRLPDYAVISEAVDWTKRRVRPRAGGLVNAVLRRLAEMMERASLEPGRGVGEYSQREMPLEDGRVLVFDRDVFGAGELERLQAQTSHGPELLERWLSKRGMEGTRALALHDMVMPPTLVTDVPAEGRDMKNERGEAMLTPHAEDGFFVFDGSHADLTSLLSTSAACRVQDPTSAMAAALTRGLEPGMVIDLCAGRGTKTRQLAALHPNATIVASDTSAERVKVLEQVFGGNEQVVVAGPGELDDYAGGADMVLCDVPCSNTGVLARRCEAKYRFSEAHLRELVKVQTSIVNRAAALLRPTGALVYATCSVESEENEGRTGASSERHGLMVEAERRVLPAGQPGESPSEYHDGGYAAVLRRGRA